MHFNIKPVPKKYKKTITIQLLLSLFTISILTGCKNQENQQHLTDYRNQEKIAELTQNAMHYLVNNGNLRKVESDYLYGIPTQPGEYNYIIKTLTEANKLDPERLDIHFGLAFTHIFSKNINAALIELERIINKDPDHFNARVTYAAFSKVNGDLASFDKSLMELKKRYPNKTNEYKNKFRRIDEIEKIQINIKPKKTNKEDHAIVILSYILDSDGTMNQILIDRMQQGLIASQLNPGAKIILSGGGKPQQGVTSAYLMQQWLLEQGIPKSRIILENQSIDTTGNAIYSSHIMAKLGIKHVTLVTSASHMRRSLVNYEESAKRYNLNIQFDHLAAMDYNSK